MTMDIVRHLGPLMLGSRLKRLGERLQADTALYLEAEGFAVQPSQYPLLAALDANGPMTVSELVAAVGVSQPGITRNLLRLVDVGFVEMSRVHRDQRHKTATLTAQGSEVMARSKREIWPCVGGAVGELCAGLSGSLLEQLTIIEERLEDVPLHRRAETIPAEPHPLDRVVWNTLNGPHAQFSVGGALAKRFRPTIGPISAVADNSFESHAALAALVPTDGPLFTIEVGGMAVPQGLIAEKVSPIFQFVAHAITDGPAPEGIVELTYADAPEMLALAKLTVPGPFDTETHHLGPFIGIKVDGRLAAMAGERMKLPGYAEVSGVCTHPDFQGRGYAAMLSRVVAQRILDRGETPFLHAYESNVGAIALYQKLGFSIRQRLIVTVLRRA